MSRPFNRDVELLGSARLLKNGSVIVDADGNIDAPQTGAITYTTFSDGTTTMDATTLELNRSSDVSARLVAAGSTEAATVAAHDGRIIMLDTAAGSVVTLPSAVGSGAHFKCIVSVKPTSNAHIVKVTTTDTIKGSANLLDEDSNAQTAYSATGTDDTLTLNGTTTGGQIGDWVELVDILTGVWAIKAQLVCIAGSNVADPFSATV